MRVALLVTATGLVSAGAFEAVSAARRAPAAEEQDWPFYGGDQAGTKYSPLTDINRDSVAHLAPAWQWSPEREAARAVRHASGGVRGHAAR